MLQRNMGISNPMAVRLGLEDVLGEIQHARRMHDIGRLALLTYCEVRRWARQAGETALAAHSLELITEKPYASRAEFLDKVDSLIHELEDARDRLR